MGGKAQCGGHQSLGDEHFFVCHVSCTVEHLWKICGNLRDSCGSLVGGDLDSVSRGSVGRAAYWTAILSVQNIQSNSVFSFPGKTQKSSQIVCKSLANVDRDLWGYDGPLAGDVIFLAKLLVRLLGVFGAIILS